METIRIYEEGTEERAKLLSACEELNKATVHGTVYTVGETWFDYGLRWQWTTILAENNGDSWQCLSPKALEDILFSNDIKKTVQEMITSRKMYKL